MTSASDLDGFRVLVVEDEALALIEAGDIDGALLDVNLGGERLGFRVADALASRGIPFLFASGYGKSIVTAPHLERLVLPKPFDETMLREALRGLIGRQPPR